MVKYCSGGNRESLSAVGGDLQSVDELALSSKATLLPLDEPPK